MRVNNIKGAEANGKHTFIFDACSLFFEGVKHFVTAPLTASEKKHLEAILKETSRYELKQDTTTPTEGKIFALNAEGKKLYYPFQIVEFISL